MTRREILKYCSVAGGAFLVSTKGPLPRAFASAPQSPALTPFLDELPTPPTPKPGTAPPNLSSDASAYYDPTGVKGVATFYNIIAEERLANFHQHLSPTDIWGYRDGNDRDQNGNLNPWTSALGPTFQEHISPGTSQFSGAIVRVTNNLKADQQGFGSPRLSTHLHGGHQPFFSDGFPTNIDSPSFSPVIEPAGKGKNYYDYAYPLLDPGAISDKPSQTDRPATQWYHDHVIDFTGANVYRGLVGLFQVFDPVVKGAKNVPDLGDENDLSGIGLPSGAFDVPLVLQDKIFARDGSLVFDPFNHDGFLGDTFLVNGKVQPFAKVKRRRYRLRFLNGSGARIYSIFLTNSAGTPQPMSIIATEGGLLSQTQPPVKSFMIAPAERFEVIVDFSMFKEGEEVFLENRLSQDEGRGPNGTFEQPDILPSGTRLLKFIVEETVPDPTMRDKFGKPLPPGVPVPAGMPLRPFDAISQAELNQVTTFREFVFERRHGAWVINGELAGNLNSPMARPVLNKPEIWKLKNSSGGWWHPIHIHSEFQRVLSRNGGSPPTFEQDGIARKDTTLLGPGSEVEVYLRFRDYAGPFVFHCHNIAHEDMAMMGRFDIDKAPGTPSL